MCHMHVLHQQVAVTDDSLPLRCRATADGDVLADGVVVANLAGRLLALELQVLRLGGDGSPREELIVIANAGSEVNGDIVQEPVVVSYDDVLVYHAEGAYHVVVAQFCLGVNNSHGVYLIHCSLL